MYRVAATRHRGSHSTSGYFLSAQPACGMVTYRCMVRARSHVTDLPRPHTGPGAVVKVDVVGPNRACHRPGRVAPGNSPHARPAKGDHIKPITAVVRRLKHREFRSAGTPLVAVAGWCWEPPPRDGTDERPDVEQGTKSLPGAVTSASGRSDP